MQYVLNPWHLSFSAWMGICALTRAGLFVVCALVEFAAKLANPLRLRCKEMDAKDALCLLSNSFVESIFMMHLSHFIWYSGVVVLAMKELSFVTCSLATAALFLMDDILYSLLHRLLHTNALYRVIHAHHHRTVYPSRGYVDAGNEHPLEQIAALWLHFTAVKIVGRCCELHAVSVALHLVGKAGLSCCNHMAADIRWNAVGYASSDHRKHHMRPGCNYAQFLTLLDRAMGTYEPLSSTKSRSDAPGDLAPHLHVCNRERISETFSACDSDEKCFRASSS